MAVALSVLDAAGRRRSPATMPGYHAGRPPHNKGIRYPADPPTVDEIVAVMRHTAEDRHGARLRAMIVVLWRAGLRIQEALAFGEHDLDERRGSILVRRGKGDRRREVGMDEWGWEHSAPWLPVRAELPVGRCSGSSTARPRPPVVGRCSPRRVSPIAVHAGVRRRFAPHQLRHAHALELAREGVPLNIIQRQLGHTNLGTTSITAGDRPGDHHGGAHAPGADDVGQRRAAALNGRGECRVALPPRPAEASACPPRVQTIVPRVQPRCLVASATDASLQARLSHKYPGMRTTSERWEAAR